MATQSRPRMVLSTEEQCYWPRTSFVHRAAIAHASASSAGSSSNTRFCILEYGGSCLGSIFHRSWRQSKARHHSITTQVGGTCYGKQATLPWMVLIGIQCYPCTWDKCLHSEEPVERLHGSALTMILLEGALKSKERLPRYVLAEMGRALVWCMQQ